MRTNQRSWTQCLSESVASRYVRYHVSPVYAVMPERSVVWLWTTVGVARRERTLGGRGGAADDRLGCLECCSCSGARSCFTEVLGTRLGSARLCGKPWLFSSSIELVPAVGLLPVTVGCPQGDSCAQSPAPPPPDARLSHPVPPLLLKLETSNIITHMILCINTE